MTNGYQVAVLGDHLGGLTAAALAARRGRRVLLLETQEAGATRPFDLLNSITAGPESEPVLGKVFQELGRAPFGPLGDDRVHFRALAPPLQVCLPRHRLACHVERTARTRELQREFGESHRLLVPLLQREEAWRARVDRDGDAGGGGASSLPARALASVSGFLKLQSREREFARQGFADFLSEQHLPADLAAAVEAEGQAVSRRPTELLLWAEGLHALGAVQEGLFRNAAGLRGVLDGLREAFVAAGGDARPLVALEGCDVSRTGGVRLHLAAGGAVRADRLVVDLPLEEGLALLPPESVKALERKGIGERERYEYGLLELEIAPGRLPDGMGDFLVIAPAAPSPWGSGVLLGSCPVDALEHDGLRAAEALAFFPPGGAAAGREQMLERLRTVMPFLDESLAGAPRYRTGTASRWLVERLGRPQREERLLGGWRTAVFHQPPITFLRNEEYATIGLAEAMLSGYLSVM